MRFGDWRLLGTVDQPVNVRLPPAISFIAPGDRRIRFLSLDYPADRSDLIARSSPLRSRLPPVVAPSTANPLPSLFPTGFEFVSLPSPYAAPS